MMLNPDWIMNFELIAIAVVIYDLIMKFHPIDNPAPTKYVIISGILVVAMLVTRTVGYINWMFWMYAVVFFVMYAYCMYYRFKVWPNETNNKK